MNGRALLLCGGAAMLFPAFAPLGARAADAAAPEAAAQVGEIVVTALRRADTVQKVPASISAVSADTMSQSGFANIRDIAKVVPNLNWGEHFGTTLITLRGIGSNVDSGVTEPTIALYVDGVYLPRSDMATLRAVDLDRVEVLRGPQGTLYGRNATGGAVNFVSPSPTRTFTGGISASGGSRNAYGVSGYLSGPLSDRVQFRASGGYDHDDGYVKILNTGQTLNGVDDAYGRLAVRIEPTDKVTVDLAVRYDDNTAPTAYQQPLPGFALAPSIPNAFSANYPFAGRNWTLVASGIVNWAVNENLTIRSITGYVDHASDYKVDDDGSTIPIEVTPDFRRPSKSYSEEISVLGDYSRLKWILGAFYFHEDASAVLPVELQAVGAAGSGVPPGSTISLGENVTINNVALFGDLTWSLTDKLRLNLGLRYNHEQNSYRENWSFVSPTGLPIAPPTTGAFRLGSDKALPKVALQYDITPNVNTYAQWSIGYKSGGSNLPGGDGSIVPLYRPETLYAYEAGLKSQFWDHRVTFNTAFFYYDYKGLQISADHPNPGGGSGTTFVQNADATDYGLEADLRVNVTRAFSIEVAPTLLHARFKNFSSIDANFPGLGVQNLDGKPLERSPDFTLDLGAQYRIDLGGKLLSSLTLRGNMLYSSSVVLLYYNDASGDTEGPYTIGNLSATFADAGEKTTLSFFVNNVGNTIYKEEVLNFGLGNMGNYSPPRTFGVRFTRKF